MSDHVFRQTNWGALDGAIVVLYLVLTMISGLWVAGKTRSISNFLVAGRKIRLHLAVATMFATEFGLVTAMYMAQAGFTSGFSAFSMGLVALVGTLVVGSTGFIVYKLRQSEVMTIPEYYDRRFGRRVRVIGGFLLAFSCILNYGIFLSIEAKFLGACLGFGDGIELKLVMTGLLGVVLLYTTVGGMVSVIVTDLIQFAFIAVTLVGTTWLTLQNDGWNRMTTAVYESMGIDGFDPTRAPNFGIAWILFNLWGATASISLWQTATLRALCVQSPGMAKKVYLWSTVGNVTRLVLPITWGIAAFAFIRSSPDLKEAFFPASGGGGIDSSYGLPIFFARVLPTGLLGALIAGMLAASMSSHDSYLLSWSSVITQDIVAPLRKTPLSDRARILITRIGILAIGGFTLFWGIWYQPKFDLWQYMSFTGVIYIAGAFSTVVAGLYWKRASSTGAALALLAGMIGILSLSKWDRSEYPLTVACKDEVGHETRAEFTMTATLPEPFSVSSPVLPAGFVGEAYDTSLPVSGVLPEDATRFSLANPATLPEGIAFDPATGRLRGTPQKAGTHALEIRIARKEETAERTVVLPIRDGLPAADSLPFSFAGEPYDAELRIPGVRKPARGSVVEGIEGNALPDGIRLEGDRLRGTPPREDTRGRKAPRVHVFTLRVESGDKSLVQGFTLHVLEPAFAIHTMTLPAARCGKPYEARLETRHGSGRMTWTVEGKLPEGIAFRDGVFYGTPTERFPWAWMNGLGGSVIPIITVLVSVLAMILGSLFFPDRPKSMEREAAS